MRVVIAPDKFKGSLTALEAAEAMARGLIQVEQRAEFDLVPMADGGEGTAAALVAATVGCDREITVTGPLGEPVVASFGLLGDGQTAVLEMASASGLWLVPSASRDPLRATTRGTGELLLAAIGAGAKRLIIGIGGSATNDGGAGLGQALGFRLLDSQGRELGPGGGELDRLARIERTERTAVLSSLTIAVACDVTNPLCGPQGASAVYGPQKGATPDMVARLDRNLAHFADIVARDLGVAIRDIPGSGAAGGLGGGLVAFAGGRLEGGVNLVIEAVNLRSAWVPRICASRARVRSMVRVPSARPPLAWPAWHTPWVAPPWPLWDRSGLEPRPSWSRASTPTSASAPDPFRSMRPSPGLPSCSKTPRPRSCGPSFPGETSAEATRLVPCRPDVSGLPNCW